MKTDDSKNSRKINSPASEFKYQEKRTIRIRIMSLDILLISYPALSSTSFLNTTGGGEWTQRRGSGRARWTTPTGSPSQTDTPPTKGETGSRLPPAESGQAGWRAREQVPSAPKCKTPGSIPQLHLQWWRWRRERGKAERKKFKAHTTLQLCCTHREGCGA